MSDLQVAFLYTSTFLSDMQAVVTKAGSESCVCTCQQRSGDIDMTSMKCTHMDLFDRAIKVRDGRCGPSPARTRSSASLTLPELSENVVTSTDQVMEHTKRFATIMDTEQGTCYVLCRKGTRSFKCLSCVSRCMHQEQLLTLHQEQAM